MNNTTTYKLGDIASFINGRAYSMPEMLHEGKYRIVRVGNFTGKDEWYYSNMELEPDKYCEKGDLLYKWACTFGPEIWDEEKVIYHYHIWKVVPNEALVDKDYLYYLLGHMTAQWLKAVHGSTMVHITKETMEQNIVTIPTDVSEQHVIANVLKKIDAKIANNNAICSNLEAMAKLLYDYWFVQFDFPDENGKPYKSSGGKMVWNDELKREIPEGWEVRRIGDIITTERGISYGTPNIASGEGVPMLNLATFMPGGGDYKADGLKHFLGEYPKSKVLTPYDLIMCNTQQTAIKFETDIIGRSMLVPDVFDGDIVFSHHVNVIRPEMEEMKYHLLYLFNSDHFHKYISGFTNGTNILGLSFSGVEDYLTEIPPAALLKRFADVVLACEKKKSEIILENQQLTELRDFLLPMLMNGQVKVG